MKSGHLQEESAIPGLTLYSLFERMANSEPKEINGDDMSDNDTSDSGSDHSNSSFSSVQTCIDDYLLCDMASDTIQVPLSPEAFNLQQQELYSFTGSRDKNQLSRLYK